MGNFLDAKGLQYLWSKVNMQDYPNNETLMAVINAIKYLDKLGIPKDRWCTIVLDSDYVRFGILFWSKKWEQNGWICPVQLLLT